MLRALLPLLVALALTAIKWTVLGPTQEPIVACQWSSLAKQRVTFIDARPKEAFLKKHLDGAISLPARELPNLAIGPELQDLEEHPKVVVYDAWSGKGGAHDVAQELFRQRQATVYILMDPPLAP